MKSSSRGITRRSILAMAASAPAVVGSASLSHAEDIDDIAAQARAALKETKGTKLVLLGMGAGPVPGQAQRMTSHVLVHDGAAYIVDCGLSATRQFARTGVPFSQVRSIFITHHHPDHNIELGPFLVLGWIHGLQQSVRAYGPPPLGQMTRDLFAAHKPTIDFWAEDFHRKPMDMIEVHEVTGAGVVMKDSIVTVSSVQVQHPPIVPSFAYRFDFADRSIAFSGDTVPLAAVADLAKGADVLVHEAMDVPATQKFVRKLIAGGFPGTFDVAMNHMYTVHSPTEEVGRIAAEAGVKTLVLSHLVPGTGEVSEASWREAAAKYFKGEIIVGRDLLVI